VIGGLTFVGWLAIFASLALIILMGWLGRRKKWLVGLALTIPFFAYLGYLEAITVGPPIYQDPYGPLMASIVLGPIAMGWIVFLIARLSLGIE
jgi:hypothetical protein